MLSLKQQQQQNKKVGSGYWTAYRKSTLLTSSQPGKRQGANNLNVHQMINRSTKCWIFMECNINQKFKKNNKIQSFSITGINQKDMLNERSKSTHTA